MTTLQNLNDSINGTPKDDNNDKEIVRRALAGNTTSMPQRADDVPYVIFKLVNPPRKGRVYVDGVDDVYNPDTDKYERMRLLSGHPSIWVREQKDVDAEYVRQNRRSLIFEGKICKIMKTDVTALEFARRCNHFISNLRRKSGSRMEFFEYNPAKQAEEALKKEMLELEMAFKAKDLPEDKVRNIASFVNIQFNDELGQAKPIERLRADLILYAKRNPIDFQGYLDSKEVDVQFLVKKAILDNKIEITNGISKWSSGGSIAKIPANRQPLEYLTELALTNSENGKKFLDQLNTVLK